jgi:hypothetical protein
MRPAALCFLKTENWQLKTTFAAKPPPQNEDDKTTKPKSEIGRWLCQAACRECLAYP